MPKPSLFSSASLMLESARAIRWIILAAMILTALGAFYGVKRNLKYVEEPIACDDFGYLRQARLVNTKGLPAGLDTRIDDEITTTLIRAFKADHFPVADWQEMVAPHCHHYNSAVDRVILQYPPGTGLLLSLFPEGRQARSLIVLVAALLLGGFLSLQVRARTAIEAVFICAAAWIAFDALSAFGFSMSISPSLFCAVILAGILAFRADDFTAETKWLWHAVAGVVLGLAVVARIPNAFMVTGFAACYGLAWAMRPSLKALLAPSVFALAMICGASLVFWANAINAGSPFSTTYSVVDASRPVLDRQHLGEGLRYFLFDNAMSARGIIVAVAVLIAVTLMQVRNPDRRVAMVLMVAWVSFVSNFAYFVLHSPRASYYAAPVAVFAASAALLAWAAKAHRDASLRPGRSPFIARCAAALVCSGCVAFAVGRSTVPVSELFGPSDLHRHFDDRTVIWADFSAGYFHYFQGRQASKLAVASDAAQDRAIGIVSRLGRPQVLVADSPPIMAVVERLKAQGRLVPDGMAYRHQVYRIVP